MYKGQLTGFPTEVVEKMLYYQVEQGNKRDVTVFEDDKIAPLNKGGFSWSDTTENVYFWSNVISDRNFDIFFERYPKQHQTTNTMNVKQIIKDNGIEKVYSAYLGCYISINSAAYWNVDYNGSYFKGGECLIFPSKDERNWDRFKQKEPTYKPCESVEQFADLFLGAKVKHKIGNIISIVTHVSEMSMSTLFYNYTLLDGTPLGIKCDE